MTPDAFIDKWNLALRRRLAPAALALLCGICLPAPDARAQADPWIGRWGAPQCDADAIEIVLGRSVLDLSRFEATCRVRNVSRRGKAFQLDANCIGEGPPIHVRLTVRVEGDTLRFTEQRGIQFDPKRYVRCAARAQRDAPGAVPSSQPASGAAGLPLRRGFYVASDTPCAQASHATLTLVRRDGMSAARTMCTFSNVERIARRAIASPSIAPTSRRIRKRGRRARFCLQSLLPQPWRSNDIRDLIR
jgi:hypothetical protein